MSDYQWYPGHMTKAVRMMREAVAQVDLVIELTDARIPLSGRNPDIDDLAGKKARLLVLNKADLADEKANKIWEDHFAGQGIGCVRLNAKNPSDVKRLKQRIFQAGEAVQKRAKARGMKAPIGAMIAGIPNVGKSTVINALAGRASAKTGNKPGVTKGKQWIMPEEGLRLLDTPGILWPKFEDPRVGEQLAFIGSMNDNNLDVPALAIRLIRYLETRYPQMLQTHYGVAEEDIARFLEEEALPARETALLYAVGFRRGCIMKGAKIDYERAAMMIADDFRNGRIGRVTLELPQDVCGQEEQTT